MVQRRLSNAGLRPTVGWQLRGDLRQLYLVLESHVFRMNQATQALPVSHRAERKTSGCRNKPIDNAARVEHVPTTASENFPCHFNHFRVFARAL